MSKPRAMWSRWQFAGGLTLAATASLLAMGSEDAAAEPPPETTKVRLIEVPDICAGTPLIVAQELLKGEGFTEVEPVRKSSGVEGNKAIATGEADLNFNAVHAAIAGIDAGDPIVLLAGIHVGCFELFGNDRVRSLSDLKGKRVGVTLLGSGRHLFLAAMAAHVGLDPRRDIDWVTRPAAESLQMFVGGEIDAFMGFPPEPQQLRAKRIGHVVVNTTTDKPWSQYFCCMALSSRDFVRKHPVATKRALRAILKAADMCAQEPERAVRLRVDKGYTAGRDYALQTIKELPYGRWREYDPQDTVRFYALRLYEAGIIRSNPQKIIAQGTDWRFLKELKKELKG